MHELVYETWKNRRADGGAMTTTELEKAVIGRMFADRKLEPVKPTVHLRGQWSLIRRQFLRGGSRSMKIPRCRALACAVFVSREKIPFRSCEQACCGPPRSTQRLILRNRSRHGQPSKFANISVVNTEPRPVSSSQNIAPRSAGRPNCVGLCRS